MIALALQSWFLLTSVMLGLFTVVVGGQLGARALRRSTGQLSRALRRVGPRLAVARS